MGINLVGLVSLIVKLRKGSFPAILLLHLFALLRYNTEGPTQEVELNHK